MIVQRNGTSGLLQRLTVDNSLVSASLRSRYRAHVRLVAGPEARFWRIDDSDCRQRDCFHPPRGHTTQAKISPEFTALRSAGVAPATDTLPRLHQVRPGTYWKWPTDSSTISSPPAPNPGWIRMFAGAEMIRRNCYERRDHDGFVY